MLLNNVEFFFGLSAGYFGHINFGIRVFYFLDRFIDLSPGAFQVSQVRGEIGGCFVSLSNHVYSTAKIRELCLILNQFCVHRTHSTLLEVDRGDHRILVRARGQLLNVTLDGVQGEHERRYGLYRVARQMGYCERSQEVNLTVNFV
ncbi:hypothetical protein A6I77_24655 [Achromobacter xylosoxidans]|nr:hypothetical protein A6I77_24655 [Achromobacter xylosoxidans]